MRRWWWLAAGLVVVLAAGVVTYVALRPDEATTYTVGPRGGTFGAAGGPRVEVPPGVAPAGTTIEITGRGNDGNIDETGTWDQALSGGADITASADLPGARVRFPVDPGAMPTAGGVATTVDDAFVAVYDEELRIWLPLDTEFDEGTSEIVAEAPHFSRFRDAVVGWAKDNVPLLPIGFGGLTYNELQKVPAAVRAQWAMVRSAYEALSDVVHDRETAECTRPAAGWSATVQDSGAFDVCVDERDDGGLAVRTTNKSWTRYLERTPAELYGSAPLIGLEHNDNAGDWDPIATFTQRLTPGSTLVPYLNGASYLLPAEAARLFELLGGRIPMRMVPDVSSTAFDLFLSVVAFLPSVRVTFQALARVSRTSLEATVGAGVTRVTLTREEMTLLLRGRVTVDHRTAEAIALLAAGFECLDGVITRLTDRDVDEKWYDELLKAVTGCASTAVEAAYRGAAPRGGPAPGEEAAGIIASLPQTYRSFRSVLSNVWKATDVDLFAGQSDIVVTRTPAHDWKELSYGPAQCLSRQEWIESGSPASTWDDAVVTPSAADVTGDGTAEILVQLQCPASTSSWPDTVVVFDVRDEPRLLGVLGTELYFRGATLEVSDDFTVTMRGPTVAESDPLCCADHQGTVTYRWNGTAFAATGVGETPR
jgi:hypothetical protein